MDRAVHRLLAAQEAKRPGTPARAVAQRATELGYQLVPPARGNATYLRLIRETPGRAVTLYLDAAKLGSVAQDQRSFAASVAGGIPGTKEVRFPFTSVDP